jgi:hypothetical protein
MDPWEQKMRCPTFKARGREEAEVWINRKSSSRAN